MLKVSRQIIEQQMLSYVCLCPGNFRLRRTTVSVTLVIHLQPASLFSIGLEVGARLYTTMKNRGHVVIRGISLLAGGVGAVRDRRKV